MNQSKYQGTFGITSNEHDTWLEPELSLDGPYGEATAAADIAELEADPFSDENEDYTYEDSGWEDVYLTD
jgi:hypothetical protein